MDGKAMVVCMSRRICVDLFNAIVAMRPDWHHEDDDKGFVKVVMTGSTASPPLTAAGSESHAGHGTVGFEGDDQKALIPNEGNGLNLQQSGPPVVQFLTQELL